MSLFAYKFGVNFIFILILGSMQFSHSAESSALNSASKFSLGGYGEIHWNNSVDPSASYADIHRWVLYLGYSFSDWIQFHSETELEHAYVRDNNGYLVIEQMYMEFHLATKLGLRIGRTIVPIGIINSRHEPPTFYSVERPVVEKDVIPSTWYSDGVGAYGSIGFHTEWELTLANGLNGDKFSAIEGIRGGRMTERPGWAKPAIMLRGDHHLQQNIFDAFHFGLSAYFGGADNANQDKGVKNHDASVSIFSADFEARKFPFELRGVAANINIKNAAEINANRSANNYIAENMLGYYGEIAWHFLPDAWKKGKFSDSNAIFFTRYESLNTQYKMPSGFKANPKGNRSIITFGFAFLPVSNVTIKADYSINDDANNSKPSNVWNLGLGWMF